MRAAKSLALIVIVTLFVAPLSLTQTTDSASQSRILAMENAWAQAEEHGDFKALQTLLDDSLVYIRYDGSVWNKSQYLASLKDTTSKEEQGVNESMNARVFGETAVVTGIIASKGPKKANLTSAASASPIPGFSATAFGSASPAR
jgi:ketosteroid isomerase-like protein